jgi:RimJ/RimL family protein N-acetyltransferase
MEIWIETERLILRELLPTDEEAWFEMDSDPRVHQFLGNKPVTDIEQIRMAYQSIRQQYLDNGIGRWAVVEKESGKFIGWTGLKFHDEIENNHINFVDIGYRLHPAYWGKGYATESVKAAIQYGFNHLKLDEIISMVHHENRASKNVMAKCGFSFVEAFLSENELYHWFKLTREEWEYTSSKLPNFTIESNQTISAIFQQKNIHTFQAASNYIRNLAYKRNSNKEDITCVFKDNCGTCSTKHAVLKQLAYENGFENVKLMVGIFKMNSMNTPSVKNTLQKHQLDCMPEAHCYLRYNGVVFDYTKPLSEALDFESDLIEEIEILPNQINQYKIDCHKAYLEKWLLANPEINLSLPQIWDIREQCVKDLSTIGVTK